MHSYNLRIFLLKILLHIRYYGDMVGELMCETKYSSVKIYVDKCFQRMRYLLRDMLLAGNCIILFSNLSFHLCSIFNLLRSLILINRRSNQHIVVYSIPVYRS